MYKIHAPWGAFSNHIRWLLLLDSRYKFQVDTAWTKPIYDSLVGPDWSEYTYFTGMPQWIQDECTEQHGIVSNVILDCTGSPGDKALEIASKVYPIERTWHNWLIYEHRFKMDLPGIECHHEYFVTEEPHIAINIDPELAYASYVKFNSQLNCLSQDEYKGMVSKFNRTPKHARYCLEVDAKHLYTPSLDRVWYTNIVNHFNLENNYILAAELHYDWYTIHKKAGKDMVNDLIQLYGLSKEDISVL